MHEANPDGVSESPSLEVLDAASLPGRPVSPNRLGIAGIGLVAGLLLVPLLAWLGPRASYFKYAAAAAVLGALAAGLGSYAIPNRYVSTAVLGLVSSELRTPQNVQAAARHIQEMLPPDQVDKRMRNRDLRVEPLHDVLFDGQPTSFRISCESRNPNKAYVCVREVVSKVITDAALRKLDAVYLEVLDSASMPKAPAGPDRAIISAAGGLAGLLLGIAIGCLRRRAAHAGGPPPASSAACAQSPRAEDSSPNRL